MTAAEAGNRQPAIGNRDDRATRSTLRWLLVAAALLVPGRANAQAAFFGPDSVLAFTLRADFRAIGRDRDTTNAPWHPGTLTFAGPSGPQTVPLRLRTRGAFRLRHCDLPPLRLRFSQDSVRGTPFDDLRRPKLATHCMDRTDYEQNLLHEYTLYRVLTLFTALTYPARLVRVTYEDESGRRSVTRYGFVTEDPERFAARMHGTVLPTGMPQNQLRRETAALLGVWEYFIGNTDWSVRGLHNVELMRIDGLLEAVPFDFDWSGAVNAPYARPDAMLRIRSVRERIYRGQCLTVAELEPVLARFELKKDSVAAVYRGVPDLDPRIIERTLAWYDEFYSTIADRQRFVQRVVQPDCFR